ncbi:MAG TPA: glycosyltransferase family 39 protein [Polyangiales bacterium]
MISPAAPSRWWSRVGPRLVQGLRLGLFLAASYYVFAYLRVAGSRLAYPYDVEWMEGGTLEHVARVLRGAPLYVAPTIDFVPYIYTPLYYWVCAPFAAVMGLGLPTLRLVSVLASLGTFFFLYRLVWDSTRDRLAGWVAVGLFAAMFVVGGAWLDLARVDALFLCLTMAGVWLLLRVEPNDLLAGLVFGAAFLTKQTALAIVAPLCAARALSARGWQRWQCSAAFASVVIASTALLDLRSDGWYRYYVFELPRGHGIDLPNKFAFWRNDLLPSIPFAMAATLLRVTQPASLRTLIMRWGAAVGFVGAAWASRLHSGGWQNVLMPALLFAAWMTGEALGSTCPPVPSTPASETVQAQPTGPFFVAVLCAMQFVLLQYPVSAHIPTDADRATGDALVRRIASFEGPVLIPSHGHLARLAGKPSSGQEMAFKDVLRGRNARASAQLSSSIRTALRDRRYAAIIVDQQWWYQDVTRTYQRQPVPLIPDTTTFWPRSGWRTRPTDLYLPTAAPPRHVDRPATR